MQGAQQPESWDLDHNKDKIKSETARIKTNSIDSTRARITINSIQLTIAFYAKQPDPKPLSKISASPNGNTNKISKGRSRLGPKKKINYPNKK